LNEILEGDLEELIDALAAEARSTDLHDEEGD
jgi:hypothetical protein